MIRDLLLHVGQALVERWREDPVHHSKRGVAAVAIGLVVYNAAFAQEARHDAPWFADEGVAVRSTPPSDERPAPRAAPADPVVFGIQSELMELGHYHGAIDGVTGSRTRAAIREYEITEGLPPTGEATEALLARIRLGTARDLPAPAKPRRVATDAEPIDAIGDIVATGSIGSAPPPSPSVTTDLRSVQEALRRHGAAITADGVMGPKTRAAIEAYRASRGLAPSGTVDEGLVADLRAQGLL